MGGDGKDVRSVSSKLKFDVSNLSIGSHMLGGSQLEAGRWFEVADGERHVNAKDILECADYEYNKWRSVGDLCSVMFTHGTDLLVWFKNVDIEVLDRRINETPVGLACYNGIPALEFTPWQRMAMSAWIDPPVDMEIHTEIAMSSAINPVHSTKKRKIPLTASYGLHKGVPPNMTICDFSTGNGKTAWSCSVMAMLVMPKRFEALTDPNVFASPGSIFHGRATPTVARLVIVAASASTFSHFHTTIERLVPEFRRMNPEMKFVVWTQNGKGNSVQEAAKVGPNTAVFWCIKPSDLINVLRETPHIAVAGCIVDEFTVNTPRAKYLTPMSKVCKTIITQATPKDLVDATRGNGSFLKDAMCGQVLIPPMEIKNFVTHAQWNQAQIGLQQFCIFTLMTNVTWFRSMIRNDLKHMIPPGMDIHCVRSKYLTMSGFLTKTQCDMIPADLYTVLGSYFSDFHPTQQSLDALRNETRAGGISPDRLIEVVKNMQTMYPNIHEMRCKRDTCVARLVERMKEFTIQCPVCWEPTDALHTAGATMRVFGCCGYCACSKCYTNVKKCPFCRNGIAMVEASSDSSDDEDEQGSNTASMDILTIPIFDENQTFSEKIAHCTSVHNTQVVNMVNVLRCLNDSDYKRVILIVERNSYQMGLERGQAPLLADTSLISDATGYKVHRVDGILRGKGTAFAQVKAEFDDPSSPPMVLMCYGILADFLIGTDLYTTDAVVSAGNIHDNILTQAVGRAFRPNPARSGRPVKFVKVYSGSPE